MGNNNSFIRAVPGVSLRVTWGLTTDDPQLGIAPWATPERATKLAIATTLAVIAVSLRRIPQHAISVAAGAVTRQFETMVDRYLRHAGKHWSAANNGVLRATFRETPYREVKPMPGHSHPLAAAARTSAANHISAIISAAGMEPYHETLSARDARRGEGGRAIAHWPTDLQVAHTDTTLTRSHVRTYVDCDFYYDMPAMLTRDPRASLIYTIEPTATSVSDGGSDYSLLFDADGCLHMKVTGGATFDHKLWHYDGDCVVVKSEDAWTTAAYSIERISLPYHRAIVLLAPLAVWTGFSAIVANLWYAAHTKRSLARLQPVTSVASPLGAPFVRIAHHHKDGVTIHTGIAGKHIDAATPADVDTALALHAARKGANAMTLGTVASIIDLGRSVNSIAAPLLMAYHLATKGPEEMVSVVDGAPRLLVYTYPQATYVEKDIDPETDAPGLVRAYMNPIGAVPTAPADDGASQAMAITRRVLRLESAPETPSAFMRQVVDDFVKYLVPQPHTVDPVLYEEVWAQQDRPMQRALLASAAAGVDTDPRIKSFVKKESGLEFSDPRLISTIPPAVKADYSAYVMAAARRLRAFEWNMVGKTPIQIATRVASIAMRSNHHVAVTDYSRFDGRVNAIMRLFERTLMLRLFRVEHHAELHDLMSKQQHARGVCGKFSYTSAYARLSGSPETSEFNTTDNAFMAYVAFRAMREGGGYYSHEQATQALDEACAFLGDDGLTADISADAFVTTAGNFGHKLDIELVQHGHSGLTFLSRTYGPEVWYGDVNSHANMPRALAKLGTTVHLPSNVTAYQKLIEKCASAYTNDRNTPVLGEFIRHVETTWGGKFDLKSDPLRIRGFYAVLEDESTAYPNEGEWMEDSVHRQMPTFQFAAFREWLPSCTTLTALLECPGFDETRPVVKEDLIVNGEPAGPVRDEAGPLRCRHYEQGTCNRGSKCKFYHDPAAVPPAPRRNARGKPGQTAARA